MRILTTLLGSAVALLGFIWIHFSNQAPIGLAFMLTGICLVILSLRRCS